MSVLSPASFSDPEPKDYQGCPRAQSGGHSDMFLCTVDSQRLLMEAKETWSNCSQPFQVPLLKSPRLHTNLVPSTQQRNHLDAASERLPQNPPTSPLRLRTGLGGARFQLQLLAWGTHTPFGTPPLGQGLNPSCT